MACASIAVEACCRIVGLANWMVKVMVRYFVVQLAILWLATKYTEGILGNVFTINSKKSQQLQHLFFCFHGCVNILETATSDI